MTIASFCRDLLLASGPLPLDVLASKAAAAGVTTARDPGAAVRSALAYKEVQLADGRWATPLCLLEGRILTVRGLPWSDEYWYLDDPDAPDGSRYDLAPLDAAARSCSIPLAEGGLLHRSSYGSGLRAPKGWPALRPGRAELLGLRVRDGRLEVELVPDTVELTRAGDRLARELGPLDSRSRYWSPTGSEISRNLVGALWERMAADPTFLTSPAPPFSRCIPSLTDALRLEVERRAMERRRWRPQLDLPAELECIALDEAGRRGQLVDEWLGNLVTTSLRQIDDEDDSWLGDEPTWPDAYGDVIPLQGRRWR